MIDKSKKKKKNGGESTTSKCIVLILVRNTNYKHATYFDPDENEKVVHNDVQIENQAKEDQEHEEKDTATTKETSGVQQDVEMHTPTSKDLEENCQEEDQNTSKKIYGRGMIPFNCSVTKPTIEKEKEQPKVQSPLNPIAKETAKKPAKKPKQIKEKLGVQVT
ncbi:hypothetical protein DVH24_021411 [Malus domestica]|uniref:Uncharacterized protein n=1 Tax=Malus domestica TaxID=3750 RepID=A0A498JUP7_MALDO|nr:hypothetical protein DVH24_021411 [Malus domestica]